MVPEPVVRRVRIALSDSKVTFMPLLRAVMPIYGVGIIPLRKRGRLRYHIQHCSGELTERPKVLAC